jgi:adenylate kinase
MERSLPNILVTGTPGTGKSTSSEMIADALGLQHVNVGELVRENKFYEEYLEDLDTHVLDEDKVDDRLK